MYKYRTYNKELQKLFFLPIKLALHEQSITYKELILIMDKRGFKYTLNSFNATRHGVNHSIDNFNYFTKIYDALNLPDITLDYLMECREKYNKIKPQRRKKEINSTDL
jgi:hypothetical protein